MPDGERVSPDARATVQNIVDIPVDEAIDVVVGEFALVAVPPLSPDLFGLVPSPVVQHHNVNGVVRFVDDVSCAVDRHPTPDRE